MEKALYSKLVDCRICGSAQLESVMDFGELALTGVFLDSGTEVDLAPMELGRCLNCGLVQLLHNYELDALYGTSYGYESHLNGSMRDHLTRKARMLEKRFLEDINAPVVVDIAANDGFLLQGYSGIGSYVGIDPLMENFSDYYPSSALKIKDFFTSKTYFESTDLKANLVTSLSVLYDINEPVQFAKDVNAILIDEGIWHFEQSYLPLMVDTLSYDTICHEHLTYLRLTDIYEILTRSGFQLLDVSLNSVNGGSIAVTAIKSKKCVESSPFVNHLLRFEENNGFVSGKAIHDFSAKAEQHRKDLKTLLSEYKSGGYTIVGLGASTKGNVLLQWLGLTSDEIRSIGDINPRKFGKQCPGSGIPIISEKEIIELASDRTIALVLPWHFREGIVKNCEVFLNKDAKLLFPLPRIEIVS
jgi:hypothetical protein